MNKHQRKDGVTARLFPVVKEYLGHHMTDINEIKQGVWLVRSEKEKWILKEFRTKQQLFIQHKLTRYLKEYGFTQTYQFHPIQFVIDNRVLGCIEYISPLKNQSFHYRNKQNIWDAFSLIRQFHSATRQFIHEFPEISLFNQMEKWHSRFTHYKNWFQLSPMRTNEFLQTMIDYGQWALDKLGRSNDLLLPSKDCLLHGDVAHHNFIRDKDGQLHVIDFDLVKSGSEVIDYLQLANRVLPYLQWNSTSLFQIPELKPYATNEKFLIALTYPTDVYRECLLYRGHNMNQLLSLFKLPKKRLKFYESIRARF